MPELPEVETIRTGLQKAIVGRRIRSVHVIWPGSMHAPDELTRQVLTGATVTAVKRRAKVLIWELSNDYALMFHLKMTGQLVLVEHGKTQFAGGHPTQSMLGKDLPDRSTRAYFEFEGGETVFFNDQRKFGWIKLVPISEIDQDLLVARLGPEPLSPEFTVKSFQARLTAHGRSPVKAVILDQSTVSGIGNIYADESLHLAKIHPARLAGTLTSAEVNRLYEAIRTIIALGIEHHGTSFSHYITVDQGKGDYLEHARVFRRQGQVCHECGTIIEKTRVAGRGTHYCPKCQKVPKA